MKNNLKKWGYGILIAIVSLFIISLIVKFAASQTLLSSLRIVFGSVYVLFLPGFLISYIFFPKTREYDSKDKEKGKAERSGHSQGKVASHETVGVVDIDWIERIALSFALSIAIVPLVVFYLNLIGLRINLLNSFLTILGILIISSGILYWKSKR